MLSMPLYIYSFATQRIVWSNGGARRFWNAESDEELHVRALTPFSVPTEIRLDHYLAAFRRGEDRVESWTFYPRGEASSALCRCRGVSVAGHDEAMLVEIQSLTPVDLPVNELRAIEALRHSPLKITLFSDSGEVLLRNQAASAIFDDFDRTLPKGADHFRAMFANPADGEFLLAQAARGGIASRPAPMALPGGPVHTVQVSLVTDPATGRAANLVAQTDISRFVEVGRQLAASEDALDAVLSLNVEPTLVLSAADGSVLKANPLAQDLFGENLALRGAMASRFADPATFDSFRAAVLAGGAAVTQAQLQTAKGTSFWGSLSGGRIVFEKQDAMVVMLTDVDRLYRNAAELEAALDSERQTSAMQRRFLSIAAHDFRTPLSIIDGAAQRIERGADTLAADQLRGRATRIRTAVKRLLQLLETTVESARRNQGTMGYSPTAGDLGQLISAVAASFLDSHGGNLEVELQVPQLPEISFDGHLIEQALSNLLTNANKYSDGPAYVFIRALATSEDVQIFVCDRGIGVPSEERERIFSDYVRGSNVGEKPGTGLGLSIVRQIIGLHGGSIEIVDGDLPGTTFRISLPRP